MRARTLREIAEQMPIYFVDDDAIEYDADTVKKHIKGDDLAARLAALHDALARQPIRSTSRPRKPHCASSPNRKASAPRN